VIGWVLSTTMTLLNWLRDSRFRVGPSRRSLTCSGRVSIVNGPAETMRASEAARMLRCELRVGSSRRDAELGNQLWAIARTSRAKNTRP